MAGFGVHDSPAAAQDGRDAGAAGAAVADAGATNAPAPPATQQPKKTPWYKTRKGIIILSIGAVLGIVILFVFLFPVVAAIAQLIINRTAINILTASILQPQNGSCVPSFY